MVSLVVLECHSNIGVLALPFSQILWTDAPNDVGNNGD
jgi:hypothetical protein